MCKNHDWSTTRTLLLRLGYSSSIIFSRSFAGSKLRHFEESCCVWLREEKLELKLATTHRKKKIAFPNCQGLDKVLLGFPANWRRTRKWKKQAQRHRNVSEKQHHTPFPLSPSPCTAPSLFRSSSFVQFATVTVLRPSSFVLCSRRHFVRSLYDDNCFASVLLVCSPILRLEFSFVHFKGESEPAPMTAPVGCSVRRMSWMIRLFFIRLFTLRYPTFYHSQSFLAADL
jgi:hypothetical protein